MTNNEKTPWKDGYYFNKNHTPMILKLIGNNCEIRQIVSFDFPDRNSTHGFPIYKGVWTFGDFGPATKDVYDLSKIRRSL